MPTGLDKIVAEKVHVPTDKGANVAGKVAMIVAGMVAGADPIDGMNAVRDAGARSLFGGVYAPSTLGSFLRTFSHGHVQQLASAARAFLARLVARTKVGCWPARTRCALSTSTRCCAGSTARPSRAPG